MDSEELKANREAAPVTRAAFFVKMEKEHQQIRHSQKSQ
jgi:hypothetical protein